MVETQVTFRNIRGELIVKDLWVTVTGFLWMDIYYQRRTFWAGVYLKVKCPTPVIGD